ncbi:alpha/beta fold hydrolase [Winogradskyella sp. R77965]|uniref:alpha/beta fold hydrolase n=1 Tax=Winogradskyella sp. R77965 TaxID=3093872 RepID=UPI0037DC7A45
MNYQNTNFKTVQIDTISLALREFGKGKDVFFIHGFPTHGYTWRKIIPKLSRKYKCNIIDLPGLGDSKWSKDSKFDSKSQAEYLIKLIQKMGIRKCALIAHNSGATIARVIAIEKPDLIEKLILINTEIPNHRPPWIPFYQRVGLLPFVPNLIRKALNQSWFIKSSMGFKEAYSNKSMLNNPENLIPYIKPIIASKERTIGAFRYLKGIDWDVVDSFKKSHRKIQARTLFIWGENDKTFPIKYAEKMIKQFNGNCTLKRINGASLLPHEEKSEEVGNSIIEFLED